jgi:hypothetical protein
MDLLSIIVYSFLGLLMLGLVYTSWFLIDTLPSQPLKGKKYRENSSGSTYLEKKLLRMVGGNRAIVTRLLFNVRCKNPHKSKTWCYEKVIYDLQRDRGAI